MLGRQNSACQVLDPSRCDEWGPLRAAFYDQFGYQGELRYFFAPGRVNLIGEHTDYNGGYVLPIAIDRGTFAAVMPRRDRQIRVYSISAGEQQQFHLDDPAAGQTQDWGRYVEGIARTLDNPTQPVAGADIALLSTLPLGAGLSSSAALEMVVGYALLRLCDDRPIDRLQLALAGQSAEHRFVGTRCGIMDQLIVSMGRAGHALLIDCRTLATQWVPVALERTAIVLCDSGVKHSLVSSAYNQRVETCAQAVALLSKPLPHIQSLRDLLPDQLEQYQSLMAESNCLRYVRHVVLENARTCQAAQALSEGAIQALGNLMTASHQSLRDDYAVSCPELDFLVETAVHVPGVWGARMTGGGFGGCTVNLVDEPALPAFEAALRRGYLQAYGREPFILRVYPSDGVNEVCPKLV